MKQVLNRLINHERLSKEEARLQLVEISEGHCNPSEIAAFLTVFMMRPITLEELEGFRDALLELCLPIDLSGYNTIDLCGTGGDGKNTFNISTLASFICAGAGVHVSKHGNYGVSSVSGSSNVMEHLGIRFSSEEDFLKKCLDQAGICILHAPLFHPAMKHVAPIRRALGVKTFFNMLGPMVNPVYPKNQVVGVFNLELARLYGYLYQKSNKKFTILHDLSGYDEISLTGATKSFTNQKEHMINPKDFKLNAIDPAEIYGGATIYEAAIIFEDILSGKGTPAQNQVSCANAAIAISTYTGESLTTSFNNAKESLQSGKALQSLRILQQLSLS